MIKKKTNKQKDIDSQKVNEANESLRKKVNQFVRELYDAELNIRYISIGTVSDMMESVNTVNWQMARQKEEHTYTDYEEDHDKTEWNNSTSASTYE
jgi:L-fucose isomerase-like protein